MHSTLASKLQVDYPGGMTKKQFVLNQPLDISASDIVKLALTKKIKLTTNAVHSIRSTNKHKQQLPDMSMLPTKAEALLYSIASEVGLSRSIELLSRQRQVVLKLLN
jgi:hypothetical protein